MGLWKGRDLCNEGEGAIGSPLQAPNMALLLGWHIIDDQRGWLVGAAQPSCRFDGGENVESHRLAGAEGFANAACL